MNDSRFVPSYRRRAQRERLAQGSKGGSGVLIDERLQESRLKRLRRKIWWRLGWLERAMGAHERHGLVHEPPLDFDGFLEMVRAPTRR